MNNCETKINYRIRTAQLADIPNILAVFADEVEAGKMLPRNEANMRERIQDWRVATLNNEVVGCVSLVFFTSELCEIRSLAVTEEFRKNGLGKKLVREAIDLAKERGAERVLTLTRAPYVFENFGFEQANIQDFHRKVQQDCSLCPFLEQCDETALLLQIKERAFVK